MCIFCEIVAGNIPSAKIYEDDSHLAILDISQTTYGHTLVMPKKHYDNYLSMPKEEAQELMGLVNELGNRIISNLDAKGCNILINTNEVAGQSVNHTHVHIIPRYSKDDTVRFTFSENKYSLEEVLNKIKGK